MNLRILGKLYSGLQNSVSKSIQMDKLCIVVNHKINIFVLTHETHLYIIVGLPRMGAPIMLEFYALQNSKVDLGGRSKADSGKGEMGTCHGQGEGRTHDEHV